MRPISVLLLDRLCGQPLLPAAPTLVGSKLPRTDKDARGGARNEHGQSHIPSVGIYRYCTANSDLEEFEPLPFSSTILSGDITAVQAPSFDASLLVSLSVLICALLVG